MRYLGFFLVTVFWLTMNTLLWRSEFHRDGEPGSVVPLDMVLQKILTAPDDSTLEIQYKKHRVGSCRWSPNIKEGLASGKVSVDDPLPEGMVQHFTGYTIDILDGQLDLGSGIRRIRFNTGLNFTTNYTWREFTLNLAQKPVSVDIQATATNETLSVNVQSGKFVESHSFTFSELREPEKLLLKAGIPLPMELLTGVLTSSTGLPLMPQFKQLSPQLNWEARQDWLKLGHARLRVFRLEAKLLNEHKVVVIVSRVGEILRVQLPNEIQLLNMNLVNL